jgi:hypothetical protein
MKARTLGAVVVFLSIGGALGCGSPRTGAAPATTATPATTSVTEPAHSADPSAPPTDIAHARVLTVGPPIELEIPCTGAVFVGPFTLETEGESVTLASAFTATEQTCPTVSWVNGAGEFVEVSGVGCNEAGRRSTAEQTYRYAPAEGGNSATPVYLRLTLVESVGPAVCVPVHLQLSRAVDR